MDYQFGEHYFKPRNRTNKRVCTKSTRKSGCRGQIVIKEYCLYPDFKINSELWKLKSSKSQEIAQAVAAKQNAAVAKQKIAWNAQTVWTRSNTADREKKTMMQAKKMFAKYHSK